MDVSILFAVPGRTGVQFEISCRSSEKPRSKDNWNAAKDIM